MKLYFGNTVTTVTTIMILVLLGFIGESIANRTNINYWGRRACFFWHMDWLYAVLRRRETDLIKRFRIQSMEVVLRGYSHWSVSRI